jgi:hypothetical protein
MLFPRYHPVAKRGFRAGKAGAMRANAGAGSIAIRGASRESLGCLYHGVGISHPMYGLLDGESGRGLLLY